MDRWTKDRGMDGSIRGWLVGRVYGWLSARWIRVGGWMGRWLVGWMTRWMKGWAGGWKWMHRWVGGCMDACMDDFSNGCQVNKMVEGRCTLKLRILISLIIESMTATPRMSSNIQEYLHTQTCQHPITQQMLWWSSFYLPFMSGHYPCHRHTYSCQATKNRNNSWSTSQTWRFILR